MADELSNLTIFRLSGTPSLNEIIGNFRNFPELAVQVIPAQAAPLTLYTIPVHDENGLSLLPVFTDPGLIGPPCVSKPPLPLLQTLFNAPAADMFVFNPSHPRAAAQAAEVRLDKRQLSAVIGFLQTAEPEPAGADFEATLKNEAGLGNLHRANYMASVLLAGDPHRPYGLYAEILINLGLLQEASDYVKNFHTPEFFYYRALILRHVGQPAKARQWLDKIPAGAPCDGKKRMELAWLLLEEGKPAEALDAFRALADNSSEKAAALFGAGSALIKKTDAGGNPAEINESLAAFAGAIKVPSPLIHKIFFSMGNLHFRTGNFAEAETCYRKAASLWPMVQSKANLGLALIKTGKFQEAATLINDIALTDLNSAWRLASELPRESAVKLLETSRLHRETAPTQPVAAMPSPAPQSRQAAGSPAKQPPPPEPPAVVSLEAAAPRRSTVAAPQKQTVSQQPAPVQQTAQRPQGLEIESLVEATVTAPMPTEEETRKDDFMGRAFKLASALEDELNKKIYFNTEGLTDVEKKLRLTFIKARQNPQEALEIVKDCSAFFCFLLQERYKGRLIKMPDFDNWGWPVVFDAPKHMVTYPIQRAWKLLWQEDVPEPGWLTKYLQYVEDELRSGHAEKPQGAAAVQKRIPSHAERRIDVQTEHRRVMLLTSTLEETALIELGRSGIAKIETALKEKFKPDIPPTAAGWKLLRCYGHILAEILIKDFKAAWYNTDGNDGLWSMQLPWKTFIFPIGKVYKAAANRESLSEYYEIMLAEKLRIAGGG